MIKFPKEVQEKLIEVASNSNVYLEGNIIKLIETEDESFTDYLETAQKNDEINRKKRLEITKQVQIQNRELQQQKTEIEVALQKAEDAKKVAENDLDIMQQRKQFELIGRIVNVALLIIMGVGVTTTILYGWSIFTGHETQLLGTTWSNMFGILLTNSFSIIGTIMGVKYATESKESRPNNDNKSIS